MELNIGTMILTAVGAVVCGLLFVLVSIFNPQKQRGQSPQEFQAALDRYYEAQGDSKGLVRGRGIDPEWERYGIRQDNVKLGGGLYGYPKGRLDLPSRRAHKLGKK
jgi:hypothetical protein